MTELLAKSKAESKIFHFTLADFLSVVIGSFYLYQSLMCLIAYILQFKLCNLSFHLWYVMYLVLPLHGFYDVSCSPEQTLATMPKL